MAKKTSKAVAVVAGEIPFGKFEYALSETGAWYLRKRYLDRDYISRWTIADSPLVALGQDVPTDMVLLRGDFLDLPGLDGDGVANDVALFGDIGHRYRLPL